MTFREKLKLEHPEYVGSMWLAGCRECPFKYGYEPKDKRPCTHMSCVACWDREIPEEKPNLDLNALIERAATKKDISLSIFIREGDTHISVYPYPDPSEKKGNPVAEAYKLLVGSSYKTSAIEAAIGYLGEALE